MKRASSNPYRMTRTLHVSLLTRGVMIHNPPWIILLKTRSQKVKPLNKKNMPSKYVAYTYRWSRVGLAEWEKTDSLNILYSLGKELFTSRHQSRRGNFILCKAHGVASPSVFTHKSVPYAEGLDLPTQPAPGQICAKEPMSQQSFHPADDRLNLFLMIPSGEEVQTIMELKPVITKTGIGTLVLGSLDSTVEKRYVPILHLAGQLGSRKD